MGWDPKRARASIFQVCAMLMMRPDDTEQEVLFLAGAALFNKGAFVTESEFRKLLKGLLDWNDDQIQTLIDQTQKMRAN
jgi:hypothetical protein